MAEEATFDFFQLFDAVISSSASTTEKLLALVIGRHIGRGGQAAYPSRSRLIELASCSLNSFKRSQAALRIFFEAEERRGRATKYAPKPPVSESEIEEAIATMRGEGGPKLRPTSQPTRTQDEAKAGPKLGPTPPDGAKQGRAQIGSTNGPTERPQKDSLKEEKEIPPTVPHADHRSVWIEDGVPAVANGRRAALEKLLVGKGLDLDTALVAVAGQVTGGSTESIWADLTAAIAAYAAKGGKKPRKARVAAPEEYPEDFEHFWKLYPRAIGKGVAFNSWQRLSLPQKRKAYAALLRQLSELKAKKNSPRGNLCPHPSTWINQGRFDDEPEGDTAKTDNYSFGKYVGATL